jgi:hypothetical protein
MNAKARIEKWNTKQGKSVRIVTRGPDGKFYDNVSLASLI